MAAPMMAAWLVAVGVATFLLFGFDKWQAGRGRPRVAEATLLVGCMLGGWPGGLAAMLLFRHKTAKAAFVLKFVLVLPFWIALVAGALHLAGRA